MSSESEADIPDDDFRAIEAFASNPPPAQLAASEDDVREIIAFLASTLKAPRNGADTNRVKLGAYRLALTGQPLAALKHATQEAIRSLEWLPTPAELLSMAREFTAPEVAAHRKAKAMSFNRRQRLFEQMISAIRERKLLPDELQALDEHTAKVAETRSLIVIRLDGSRHYRTPDAIRAHMDEIEGLAARERTKHAGGDDEGSAIGEILPGNGCCGSKTGEGATHAP